MTSRDPDEASVATVARALESADTASSPGRDETAPVEFLDSEAARYERLKVLGEGGMGKVWLLRDERIGRRVAQKVLLESIDDPGMRARFLREARLQGQLEHPAVVPVYDLGTGTDGKLYFTMKRVRGVTLSDVIARSRGKDPETLEKFSQRRLLTAFAQVCLAVDFAHERGVVHRDLKPDSLMLGDHGEIYVLDWGVARVMHEDNREVDSDSPSVAVEPTTQKSGLTGTPGYIAPDQLRGGLLGPSADVFALGAILVEILTHQPLFGTGTTMQRLHRSLEPFDVRALVHASGRDVPIELVAICARATAPDPHLRTPSCRALHDALDAWLDGERDQQARRQLAEQHLANSRAAMLASRDDLEAHKRALHETGRALALVPDHPEARAVILSLFASSPSTVPPEVEAAIELDLGAQARIMARGGALGMASMLLFLPALMLLGVRNWVGVSFLFTMVVIAAVISAAVGQRKERSAALLYVAVFFNNLVFALCAGLYGPLVLVPSMVITNTVVLALHLEGKLRQWAIGSACLAVALPVVLSATGVTPVNYLAQGGGILMRPLWLELPPMGTLLFVAIGTLIAIVNGAFSVVSVRDSLTIAERRLQMQR